MKRFLTSKYVGLVAYDLEAIYKAWEAVANNTDLTASARKMALTELEEMDALFDGILIPAAEAAQEAGENVSNYTVLELINLVEGHRGPIIDVEKVVKGGKELARTGVNHTLSAVNKAANWVATKTSK